jgi:hypothetical protein
MGREEGEQCRSKRHCFGFFFFLRKRNVIWKKKKKIGSDPKMSYDSCPSLYNAYGAKTFA